MIRTTMCFAVPLAALLAAVACSDAPDQERTVESTRSALRTTPSSPADATKLGVDFVPNELIIKISGEAGAVAEELVAQRQSFASVNSTASRLDELNAKYRVSKMKRLSQRTGAGVPASGLITRSSAQTVLGALRGQSTVYRVKLHAASWTAVQTAAAEYAAASTVEYAVPNYLRRTQGLPTDPLYPDVWAHSLTGVQAAHDANLRGSDSVKIAIIDSGVNYTHEDLEDRIWYDENGNPGWDAVDVDVDSLVASGAGLVDGEDYTTSDDDPSDFGGHGTACAGVAAATADNGAGIAGVAPGARIMPVRAGYNIIHPIYGEVGVLDDASIVAALDYATDHGADVINMSFGGPIASPAIAEAIQRAAGSGAVLVAAAGNAKSTQRSFPAAYPEVIAVAATTNQDARASYSSFGSWVDVSAPGGDRNAANELVPSDAMLTTVPTSGGYIPAEICGNEPYCSLVGTSFASPYAAGVAALLRAQYPDESAAEVRGRLLAGVDPVNDPLASQLGTGRVNAYTSLTASAQPFARLVSFDWEELSGNRNGIPEAGERFKVLVGLENVWAPALIGTADLVSLDESVVRVDVGGDSLSAIGTNQVDTAQFEVTVLSNEMDSEVTFEIDVALADTDYTLHEQTLRWQATTGIKQVTSVAHEIANTALSGSTAAYLRWDPDEGTMGQFNIYTVDVLTGAETRVTNVPEYSFILTFPESLAISQQRVVYSDNRSGNFNVYLWHPADGERRLSDLTGRDVSVDVSRSHVVWNRVTGIPAPSEPDNARASNAYELVYLDADDPGALPVVLAGSADGSANAYRPKVAGDQVLYTSFAYSGEYDENGAASIGNIDVLRYDLGTGETSPVLSSPDAEELVDVSDSKVLFLHQDATTQAISLRVVDMETGIQEVISSSVDSSSAATISGNLVTWEESYDIFVRDLETQETTQLSFDEAVQTAPRVSGNRVLFGDSRRGSHLCFAELGPATGDVNYDSEVTIVDAQLVAQYYVGLDPAGFHPEAADVNCDGSGDIVDAQLIAQYYVGLHDWLPFGSCSPD